MLNSAANAAPSVISSRPGALTALCTHTGPQIPTSVKISRLSERSGEALLHPLQTIRAAKAGDSLPKVSPSPSMQQELQEVHALLQAHFYTHFFHPQEDGIPVADPASKMSSEPEESAAVLSPAFSRARQLQRAQRWIVLSPLPPIPRCHPAEPMSCFAWTGNIIHLTDQWECTQLPSTGNTRAGPIQSAFLLRTKEQ